MSKHRQRALSGALFAMALLSSGSGAPAPAVEPAARPARAEPRFGTDVMAVLSKAGCNTGVCHGKRSGQGGFKLSLRGQDPDLDFLALSREAAGRRIDSIQPDRSLILQKPTLAIPHEGGLRFQPGSEEHGIIRAWIRAGAPPDPPGAARLEGIDVSPPEAVLIEPAREVRLEVRARFSDGTSRDVSRLAVYELSNPIATVTADGLVEGGAPGETTILVRYLRCQEVARVAFVPARPGFVWSDPPATGFIDDHVFAKLRTLRMNPSGLSTDAVFLRRLYLDLLGLLPTADEARAFLSDPDPGKRSRLIDEILERPELADFWALKWSDFLRVEERTLDRKGVHTFHSWIRLAISSGMPLDRFAREILTARGSTYKNPAANFHRALRDPVSRAEAAAQVFLGTRLQCAKCHHHPFDRWTEDDYHAWASLFARVEYKVLENRRRDKNDQLEFKGEQVVWMAKEGDVKHPRTGLPVPPRFLGASGSGIAGGEDRLDALADWLTAPDNTLFARAQANRIWSHLLGRGIVEPADDLRATNPPSHPELLDALARELVRSGFDLRHMIRLIVRSRVYQLSPEPNETNAADERNFARAMVRRLSAEQLLDCQSQVTGVTLELSGYPAGLRAAQLPGALSTSRRASPTGAEQFLKLFGRPPRLLACECERSAATTMGQTFQLISGSAVQELLTRPTNRLGRLLSEGKTPSEAIEDLYWAALARPPAKAEAGAAFDHVTGSASARAGLEDVAWSILNAKEFVLRR